MRAIDIFSKCVYPLAVCAVLYDAMSEGRLYNDDNDDEDDRMDIKIKLRKYRKKTRRIQLNVNYNVRLLKLM